MLTFLLRYIFIYLSGVGIIWSVILLLLKYDGWYPVLGWSKHPIFQVDDSSELKHISGEEKEPGFPNSRNQVMINEGNISVGYELYLDTYCMVQVAKTL